jgi:hypothetical protein
VKHAAMPTPTVSITKVSGMSYAAVTVGGSLEPSANGSVQSAPTVATSHSDGAKRRHLRLVR